MLNFVNDYAEGAHEKILDRLRETNRESTSGYGTDPYCASAAKKIKEACGCASADVYFLTGGTQTNQVVIDTMLAPYEGVVTADTGHINGHEAGAIEACGHKVLGLPHEEGKLPADALRKYIEDFYADENHDHMVFPGMAYISHPTEYGTLYTRQELAELSAVCRDCHIPLYLDGARLGYGLACPESDVGLSDIARYCDVFYIGGTKVGALCGEALVFTKDNTPKQFVTLIKQHGALLAELSAVCRDCHILLYLDGARLGYGLACPESDVGLPDIARYCDVFYIGGTKVGALCGEALVFTKDNTPKQFVTLIKQHGALLAKGRLLGIQFDVLFTDGLYLENGRHALHMAELLREAFEEKGYSFYLETPTNQIFIVLENVQMEELRKKVNFSFWERLDDRHTVVRFVTSWATEESAVRELISIL